MQITESTYRLMAQSEHDTGEIKSLKKLWWDLTVTLRCYDPELLRFDVAMSDLEDMIVVLTQHNAR